MGTKKRGGGALLESGKVMEEEVVDNRVLRTVFLPISLDRRVQDCASQNNIGNGDIIRVALERFLNHPTLGEKVVEEEAIDDTVLRTVFLPVSLDKKMQNAASQNDLGSGDIIRLALERLLNPPEIK
mgnify:CR=1 FL=1